MILTKKQKQQLKQIEAYYNDKDIHNFSQDDFQNMNDILNILCANGVLQDLEIDNANVFRRIGSFAILDKCVETHEKERRDESRSKTLHDLLLVVVGAIVGGVVEYILFHFFGIGG